MTSESMTFYLQKYLEYLQNVGGCISKAKFDEDWEPVGPGVRRDLVHYGFAVQSADTIRLLVTLGD